MVARGFTQREVIEYQEVFAHVLKHVLIKTLLSVVVNLNLDLEQMDVKMAFLHGDLEENLYMSSLRILKTKNIQNMCVCSRNHYTVFNNPHNSGTRNLMNL